MHPGRVDVIALQRTYPAIRPPYRFAPQGERSVARGYSKAIARAEKVISVEDQYFWGHGVAEPFGSVVPDHEALPEEERHARAAATA